MVSILIGHNNLCDFCDDEDFNGPETFGRLVEESIQKLYEQVPRLFINLIPPIDVTLLYEASTGNLFKKIMFFKDTAHVTITGLCSVLHSFECACAVKDAATRQAVSEVLDDKHLVCYVPSD